MSAVFPKSALHFDKPSWKVIISYIDANERLNMLYSKLSPRESVKSQFTSSNTSKVMKYDRRDYPHLSDSFHIVFFRWYISNVPLWVADNYIRLIIHSDHFLTSKILMAIRYEYGRSLSALVPISNVVFLQTERFPTDALRRPVGMSHTVSLVNVCIESYSRPPPRWHMIILEAVQRH